MSSLLPVALWSLHVTPSDGIVPAVERFPATVRLTMAAIDPTVRPHEAGKPKRATLKLLRYPSEDAGQDSDEEESEDDSDEEEAGDKKSPKEKKSNQEDNTGDSDDNSIAEDDDMQEFVVCTLDSDRNCQQSLDIVIGDDEFVYVQVVGNYDIYLTGNYVVSPSDAHDRNEHDDDDDYDLSPSEDEFLYSVEETDSDELDDLEDPPRIREVDTDEEEAEKTLKAVIPVNGATKKDKKAEKVDKVDKKKADKKSLKRTVEVFDNEPRTIDEMIEEAKSAAENRKEPEKKLSKKQLKKLKANDGKAVDTTTDSKAKEAKKVQFAKELEQGPSGSPATTEKEKKAPTAKRVVQGVTIMDSKVGTGAAAKTGSKLCMRYIGKLGNGKVFDSNTKGKPFTFQLGKGEVIKGWDVGLDGMRVGGERRLNIPPALAYGKRGMPGIPSNSNLIFDVKLTDIK